MGVVVPVITSNGEALDTAVELVSVEVLREVNRIPTARLIVADGELAQRTFPALDSAAFAPGAEIEIKAREEDVTVDLFKGLVARVRLELGAGRPLLTIECKDKAFKLTRPRRSEVYADVSDADAVAAILDRTGVTAGELPSGDVVHPRLVQFDASDWDFIASRADANGWGVVLKDGELSLKAYEAPSDAVLELELGRDEISELELELDAGEQHPAVEAVGWDAAAGALSEAAAAQALTLAQGNVDPADAGDSLGLETAVLTHAAPVQPGELAAWATAREKRNRLAMIRGRLTISGSGDVQPMDTVSIEGVGERFNGSALVSGVRHVLEDNGWRTDLQLGLSPENYAATPDILDAEAGGLLPAARGLHIGLVHDFADDPDGEYRVNVTVAGVLGAGDGALCARLATPDAGAGRGFFFRPDKGDEVVVGFLAGDPRQPVVLGALFGARNAPPDDFASLSEENLNKGLQTSKGAALLIVDQDKPIVTVKTPSASVVIDDDAGEMSMTDGNGNSLVLSADGVTITSAGAFAIEASGAVTIKGSTVEAN